jgi:hypothetical protein
MHEMSETAVRDLLEQAMAGDEPPIGPDLLGGAVRAAGRARRRQAVAGIGVAAAMVPVLAFGVPALAGVLSPAAPGHQGGSATTSSATTGPAGIGAPGIGPAAARSAIAGRSNLSSRAAKPFLRKGKAARSGSTPGSGSGSGGHPFVRPKIPLASPDPNPEPITDQSLGQLLIDDLPAGAQRSQIMASTNTGAQTRVAEAEFNDVSTAAGAGTVQASMMVAGSSAVDFGCPAAGATGVGCESYSFRNGVRVAEEYTTGQAPDGGGWESLMVSVFRPGVAEFDIMEANSAMAAGSAVTKGMPLTLGQILTATLDPRWQFTIGQSFVQQASGLKVAPLNTAGS